MILRKYLLAFMLLFAAAGHAENTPVTGENEKTVKAALHETKAVIDQHQAISAEQVEELKKQNQMLKDQLSKMQQQLDQTRSAVIDKNTEVIQQKLIVLDQQEATAQKKRYQIDLHLAIGLMVLGFLILTFIFTSNRKIKLGKLKPLNPPENPHELEEEYDFMNTQEAWPVKLDLARAYMDMKDFENAKILLMEIKNCPDKRLVKEANKLINQLPVI